MNNSEINRQYSPEEADDIDIIHKNRYGQLQIKIGNEKEQVL